MDLHESLLGKHLSVGLPSVVPPFVHHMGLVAVDSFGVQVVVGGHLHPGRHLDQVGQPFPLVEIPLEVIPLLLAVVLVETVEDVPLLVVEMFEIVVVLLSWRGTGGCA